ncbi:MAG TPA: hypothetical protein VNG93_12840 [Candidatus Dormibacteraeota bacterium]|nr:hypothetical protein [Candidatus Dormibacteraeota bacterium]
MPPIKPKQPSPIHYRWALLVGAFVCLVAALSLLLSPASPQGLYAFDIHSPLAARFLGGCYLAGSAALAVAWRERAWGGAAVIGPGVFAASALTLVVTLMTLDRLHLTAAGPVATAMAWAWLALSVLGPFGWLYLVFANDRGWVADPAEREPLPRALRVLVSLQAVALLAIGGWLFVAPDSAPWPWILGSPTDQLVGAWLVAGALTGLSVVAERDEGRSRPAFAAGLVFSGVQLLAPLLSPGELGFTRRAIVYWVVILTLLLAALAGLGRGLRDRRARAAPFVR